jgi:hypothetical protein
MGANLALATRKAKQKLAAAVVLLSVWNSGFGFA